MPSTRLTLAAVIVALVGGYVLACGVWFLAARSDCIPIKDAFHLNDKGTYDRDLWFRALGPSLGLRVCIPIDPVAVEPAEQDQEPPIDA